MGFLAAFAAAHDAYTRAKLKRDSYGYTPAVLCHRCGCDTITCRELNCPPQDTPQTEDSLNSRNRYIPETRYSYGMKDTR